MQLLKNISNGLKKEVLRENQGLKEELAEIRESVLGERQGLIESAQFEDLKSELLGLLEEKVDVREVQSALTTSQQDVAERLKEIKHEFLMLQKETE